MTASLRSVAALVAAIGLAPLAAGAMQESVEKSMAYVEGLPDDCTYDHGYECLDVTEDDFLGRDADRAWTPGPYLEAWRVSYEDFLAIDEMTPQQKKLKHYKLGFTENDTQYIVVYLGLLLPLLEDGEVVGTMRVTYGMSTKYWINKRTLEIDKRLFLR